jgi:hypothetical protein
MSDNTWYFKRHNAAGLTREQIAFNAEIVALTTGIYELESELARKRKRLVEMTGERPER